MTSSDTDKLSKPHTEGGQRKGMALSLQFPKVGLRIAHAGTLGLSLQGWFSVVEWGEKGHRWESRPKLPSPES